MDNRQLDWRNLHLGLALGWQEIKQSYRRSVLGQLWITIGMAVTIASIGLVFGTIFGSPMEVFLPYLASGIIMWGLLSGILTDGALAFINSENMIKQIPLNKIVYIVKVVWKNVLVTAHNIVIFPILLLLLGRGFVWQMLLWPFGVLLAVSSVAGMAMSLAVLSTRFRDVPPIVGAIVTVAFYVTPVIWMAENLGDNQLAHLLLGLNPFYHLLQVSRLPMLGQLPTLENWALAAASAVIFWVMGMLILKKYQHKIPYWV